MTSAPNSRRPVTVSSMSSLDSSASFLDAAFDKSTGDHDQMPVPGNNVVSSSTLSSIGASPTLTGISEKEVTSANNSNDSSVPTGMLLSAPYSAAPAATLPAPVASAPPHAASAAPNTNTVAEFLFQLSKMLTDDNREIIEWSNGQINVHDPYRLQSEVLHNYFRHSKFASFQRQLNYFGFRKLAGKGKMAPCSYVNEATTADIRSLLLIKRKAGPAPSKEKGQKKRSRSDASASNSTAAPAANVNPVLVDILHRTTGTRAAPATAARGAARKSSRAKVTSSSSQQELARAAVGKGVRHGLVPPAASAGSATEALASASMIFPDPPQLGLPDLENSLSELTNNYHNSLQDSELDHPGRGADGTTTQSSESDPSFQMYNFLSRDSSLVDLAMLIPTTNADEADVAESSAAMEPTPVNELSASAMSFLDFPGMDPSNETDASK